MCRVLGVSTSGYYAWRSRQPSARESMDSVLVARLKAIHAWLGGTYGAPRIHAELVDEGWRVGPKRVARLMRQAGLRGVCRRRWIITTRRNSDHVKRPDLVNRQFTASQPNALYVATSRPERPRCTWRSCWTSSAAVSLVGRWPRT